MPQNLHILFLKASLDSGNWLYFLMGEGESSHCEGIWMQEMWFFGEHYRNNLSRPAFQKYVHTLFAKLHRPHPRILGKETALDKSEVRRSSTLHKGLACGAPWLPRKRTLLTLTTYDTFMVLSSKGCHKSLPASFVTLNKCQERFWPVPSYWQPNAFLGTVVHYLVCGRQSSCLGK